MSTRLVVVGDALLDRDVVGRVERLCPDAPVPVLDETSRASRPGGAGLAAALAAAEGHEVTLVTALADDEAGRELRGALVRAGVHVADIGLEGPTPEKIRLRADGQSLLRLDRGGGGAVGELDAAARAAIGWASAVLVADYGRGVAAHDGIRNALRALGDGVTLVWDPHPHGPDPVPAADLVTPNAAEAARLTPEIDGEDKRAGGEPATGDRAAGERAAGERAEALRRRWSATAVCVTRGAAGAVLSEAERPPLVVAAEPVHGADPCGAGDCFAAAAAAALGDGAGPAQAVQRAVEAATTFVAAGGAGAARLRIPGRPAPARDRRRGTLVATGGCFDLLHAGHVRTLRAARALGDRLVVLLNSDESVRRLKGPSRPLVPEADRAAVLSALACVDEVVVFAQDTPAHALDRLRPEVWVKGGDYEARELPEAAVLARWGGRVEILPYLAGRSTTRLIEEADRAAS